MHLEVSCTIMEPQTHLRSVQMVTGSALAALIPATDGACIWRCRALRLHHRQRYVCSLTEVKETTNVLQPEFQSLALRMLEILGTASTAMELVTPLKSQLMVLKFVPDALIALVVDGV